VPMAATLDKVFVPTIFENDSIEFSVSNPSLTSGHISYHVKGVDRQGPWEGQRRYSHFFQLREVICSRWPGIVIPRIPPKKAIGAKELRFITERRFYLERFLRKSANLQFLINCEEFLIFSRPNGDIEKNLGKLPLRLPTGT